VALGDDVGIASAAGAGADELIADDLAFVMPWGFDPSAIQGPVLLVHGGRDRVVPPSHSDRLPRHCPNAELWVRPRDGHVSVLETSPVARDWLIAHA
jgi:pimeloyl-ACP methyl ester carboxylesterase